MSTDTRCDCTAWYELFDAAKCSPDSLVADTIPKLVARYNRFNHDTPITVEEVQEMELWMRQCEPSHKTYKLGTMRL